jgi:hypothetical protein
LQKIFLRPATAHRKQFSAFIVTATRGYHHESLQSGVLAIRESCRKNFFDAPLFENPNAQWVEKKGGAWEDGTLLPGIARMMAGDLFIQHSLI